MVHVYCDLLGSSSNSLFQLVLLNSGKRSFPGIGNILGDYLENEYSKREAV